MRRTLTLLLLLGVAPGCGIPKDQHNATLAELAKIRGELDETSKSKAALEQQLRDLEKQNADLKSRVEAMGTDIGKAERDKATMASDLANMKKTLEDLKRAQAAAEKRTKAFRDLVAKFKAMVDAGTLQVEVRNGLMLVKLPDNILFESGKTDLKPQGKEAIIQVTKVLAGIADRKFQVTGHTDNQPLGKKGKFKSNWDLSMARALTVLELMRANGMDEKRLSAAGYADVLPVAGNDSDEGRQKNRRIEIVLVPNIEDLPPMDDAKQAS